MSEFDIKKVEKYLEKFKKNYFDKNCGSLKCYDNKNVDAIFAFFDSNCDGTITKKEFEKNIAKYEEYTNSLKEYNTRNNLSNESIFSQEELEEGILDGYISREELYEEPPEKYFANGTKLKETKNLKDYTLMTTEEMAEELKSYSFDEKFINDFKSKNIQTQRNIMSNIRQEKNKIDENSNVVDWHIGTFNQGGHGNCTLLSALNLKTDEDLHNLYKKKVDKKGNVYYEVRFPQEPEKNMVIVTEYELKSNTIRYKGQDIVNFSTGDEDVKLIEMAHIKCFGTRMIYKGSHSQIPLNQLSNSTVYGTYDDITEDMLRNMELPASLSMLTRDYLNEVKKLDLENFPIGNGVKASMIKGFSRFNDYGEKYDLQLSNGVRISGQHAYSITAYNPETREITLADPNENSTSIVLPFEAMPFFSLDAKGKNGTKLTEQ